MSTEENCSERLVALPSLPLTSCTYLHEPQFLGRHTFLPMINGGRVGRTESSGNRSFKVQGAGFLK